MDESSNSSSTAARLKKNLFSFGGIGAVTKAASLLAVPVYTAYITPAEYGKYHLAQSVGVVFAMFTAFGLHSGFGRLYFRYRDDGQLGLFLSSLLRFFPLVILLIGGLSIALGDEILGYFVPDFAIPFAPLVVLGLVTNFANVSLDVPTRLFQIESNYRAFIWLKLVPVALGIALTMALIFAFELESLALMIGQTAPRVLVVVLVYLALRDRMREGFDVGIVRSSIAFSLPLLPYQLMNFILGTSDRFVLERYATLADIGVYSLGYTLGATMLLFCSITHASWQPIFYDLIPDEREWERIAEYIQRLLVFLLVIATGGVLVAKPFVELFFDAGYAGGAPVTAWVIAGLFFHGVFVVFHLCILQRERSSWMPAISVCAAAVNLATCVLLVPRYGILGAAWSTSSSDGPRLEAKAPSRFSSVLAPFDTRPKLSAPFESGKSAKTSPRPSSATLGRVTESS